MSVTKTILTYFKSHKLKALSIIISIIVVSLLALAPASLLRIIVDEAIEYKNYEKLILFSIIYGVTYIIIGIITFIKDLIMLSTSQDITSLLRLNMMKKIHKMNYKAIVNSDSGTLEAYFNNDVQAINSLFTSGVINMITDSFKMIAIIVNLFIFSYIFGGIVLLIFPFLALFTIFVKNKMMKAQLKTKSLEGNVNKILLENVENIEQIKINKAEDYAKEKYSVILKNHFKTSQASNLYDAVFSPIMQIIRNIVVVGILLISGINPSFFGMSVGMIIASISLITDLFTPIESLGMEIQTIQKSLASVKRINSFFKFEDDDEKVEAIIESYDINYQNVKFAYEEKTVISNFNLEIKLGEKVAFQGPSGAGKSTLMKLAMGVIKPNEGSVTIGGIDTYSLSDKNKLKLFSIVYQDPFFSGGTIYEEISLLDKTISKKMVFDALAKVGLEYIKDIDQVLNPSIYSSGEIALLNIARVVVSNTKIVFLDEMNAKIDPITAKEIINLINQLTKDKIVISINHYGDILENAKIIKIGS